MANLLLLISNPGVECIALQERYVEKFLHRDLGHHCIALKLPTKRSRLQRGVSLAISCTELLMLLLCCRFTSTVNI